MTIFLKLGRFVPAISLILLVSGSCAILAAVTTPYLGLGLKEEFFLYRLAGWSRSDLFRMGIFSGLAGLALAMPTFMRRINSWRWMAGKFEWLQAYFALPPVSAPYSFNRRDQKILLAAAALFQTVYLFIVPLGVECDAAMYFNYAKFLLGIEGGVYTHYRPPGFPLFLIATGQLLFDSFIGTVIAHAAMGVLMPVLVYRSLVPINRRAAFICAFVLMLSGVPFVAAKLMLSEHLFTFFIVGIIYSFSRYYFSRDPRFIYLVIFLGLAAMFTRWGGLVPLLLAGITLVIVAHKETGHLRHLVLALSVVTVVTGSYSFLRSLVLNEPALFGSLHNALSPQMFYRAYSDLTLPTMRWHQLLGLPGPDKENILRYYHAPNQYFPEKLARALKLVDPANGPATRRLRELIVTVATENPDGYRRLKPLLDQAYKWPGQSIQDYYQEYFGQFDGDAEAMAENFFNHPSSFYHNYIYGELNLKLGIPRTDALLNNVAVEAVWAHPIILMCMLDQGMTFFGLNFEALANRLRGSTSGIPLMMVWGEAVYSKTDIDPTGCVASALPPEMQAENLQDQRITFPLTKSTVFTISTAMRNLVRNTAGIIVLFTWWFIPFSRYRAFFIFVAASALAFIGVVSIAGTGSANSRLEVLILSLILIATTGAILALREFFQRLGVGKPNESK